MPEKLYILNINNLNAENYMNFNYKYDYFALSQGLGMPEIAERIFGLDLENLNPQEYIVKKYVLPHKNYAWLISSRMFKHYYIFLLNPDMKDEVVIKGKNTYYTNVCAKCGTKVTSFAPLPKVSYGTNNEIYLCPKCINSTIKIMGSLDKSRKGAKRTELENRISDILNSLGVQYEQEKVFNLGAFNKVVDFYIPCGKLIIEGNGLAFHSNAVAGKMESTYGQQAFFVNVMKDLLSAYELTKKGYYVYIITEEDLADIDLPKIPKMATENLNKDKVQFLKDDLEQILQLRGCNIKTDFNIFRELK